TFPKEPVKDALPLLVAGDGSADLHIHQDARIYGGRMNAGTTITHPITHQAYLLVSEGEIEIDGKHLHKGDGAEVTSTDSISITALTDAELLVIDAPTH